MPGWWERVKGLFGTAKAAPIPREPSVEQIRRGTDVAYLEACIEEFGLLSRREAILALALPAVGFTEKLADEGQLALGCSKLGGRPDLPEGAEWPVWEHGPLDFLGQLELADVAGLPGAEVLPPQGRLWFFYSVHVGRRVEQVGWQGRVLFCPDDPPLVRREPPVTQGKRFQLHPACTFETEPAITVADLDCDEVRDLELTEAEDDAYANLLTDTGCQFQMLGHAQTCQTDPRGVAQLEAMKRSQRPGHEGPPSPPERDFGADLVPTGVRHVGFGDEPQWQLLFQFGSSEAARMYWGDGGQAYFYIRASDLAARRFDEVIAFHLFL